MNFADFLQKIGLSYTTFWGILAFAMSIGIEVIPKIKWSPWSALFLWIGSKINDKIDRKVSESMKKIESVENKVDKLQNELDSHIRESEDKALQEKRRDILDFSNACLNKRRHTREQFEFIISLCDEYEQYIEDNNIKNGVIESAIRDIRRLYDKCRAERSFLISEEEWDRP